MTDKISVLIVDDHPVVREGLASFLETEDAFAVQGAVASGEDAVRAAEERQPDVVLMDLVMPGMDGIEAIRHIKSARPETRIIVMTSFSQDDKLFPAIKAGADGYLLKDTLANDLVDAVKSAFAGRSVLHPDVAQKLMHSFSNRNRPSLEEKLTPRETEVIELIACGLSNEEIANRLVISDKTVKTHVSNILHKLNLAHRTQAALYAINHRTP
ncbi:MAG: response regulator transcription factor [Dehalococcoidales bacterium]